MTITKVAIFVDGKNFYEGLRSSNVQSRIDFGALANAVVNRTTADRGVLTGLHYFTGIDYHNGSDEDEEQSADEKKGSLAGFLAFLETQPGCFVYRFPRRSRSVKCSECGHEHSFGEEKAVDTSLVATMIRQAAIDAFDAAVLCSGDADHTPALDALRDLGKPTWVATFAGHGLSRRLRQSAFGHINLIDFRGEYTQEEDEDPEDFNLMIALQEAEEHFGEDNYVGYNLFVDRWRSDSMPRNIELRRELINQLIDDGLVEIYEASDGCKALRIVKSE